MAREEDDDLYDEEFDFVDDDESDVDEEDSSAAASDDTPLDEAAGADDEDEVVDEYGRPEPAANYVVHIYEHKRFTRTIDRAFTPEDAELFATEYNRASKSYHRLAVTGKNDTQPKKLLD